MYGLVLSRQYYAEKVIKIYINKTECYAVTYNQRFDKITKGFKLSTACKMRVGVFDSCRVDKKASIR